MDYYLLSDQDLDEIFWEVENLAWRLKEKIADKFIHDQPMQEWDEKSEGD
jgi:hypothetical protein